MKMYSLVSHMMASVWMSGFVVIRVSVVSAMRERIVQVSIVLSGPMSVGSVVCPCCLSPSVSGTL